MSKSRLLIDTHTLIWAVDDPAKLSVAAAAALHPANDLLLSHDGLKLASKIGQGKLILSLPYRQWMDKAIADLKLIHLPITVEYADRQVRHDCGQYSPASPIRLSSYTTQQPVVW